MNIVKVDLVRYLGCIIQLHKDDAGLWGWVVTCGPGSPIGAFSMPPNFRYRTRCLADAKRHIDSREHPLSSE